MLAAGQSRRMRRAKKSRIFNGESEVVEMWMRPPVMTNPEMVKKTETPKNPAGSCLCQ